MLAGMMARPRAISSRTNSGVISSGIAGAEADCRRASAERPEIFARGDEFHFLGDEALARIMKLGDIACPAWRAAACARRGRIAAPTAARRASARRLRACGRGPHIPRHRRAPESSRGARRPGPSRCRSSTVSSVYGPDVSYSRTGASPPDSATSRNGTPSTISFLRAGQARRA